MLDKLAKQAGAVAIDASVIKILGCKFVTLLLLKDGSIDDLSDCGELRL